MAEVLRFGRPEVPAPPARFNYPTPPCRGAPDYGLRRTSTALTGLRCFDYHVVQ
jgi:hypothetical protein